MTSAFIAFNEIARAIYILPIENLPFTILQQSDIAYLHQTTL